MVKHTAYYSMVIDAPVSQCWPIIREFGNLVWHPLILESSMEEGAFPTQVGGVRKLLAKDGGIFREKLVTLDDLNYVLVYEIVDSPLPVANYVAVVRLHEVVEGQKTFAEWYSDFLVVGDNEFVKEAAKEVYRGGLQALSKLSKTNTAA
jgi:hypothetical protein